MSIKTKTLNVHADSPDLRDRIYNPTLRLLGKTLNAQPFADKTLGIANQGSGPDLSLDPVVLSSLPVRGGE